MNPFFVDFSAGRPVTLRGALAAWLVARSADSRPASPRLAEGVLASPIHRMGDDERRRKRDALLLDEAFQENGYFPGLPGDSIREGKYILANELGRGESATVWLARERRGVPLTVRGSSDASRAPATVAIKIFRCEAKLIDSMDYERQLLNFISAASASSSARRNDGARRFDAQTLGVVNLVDSFSEVGRHGTHGCLVFEELGPPVDWVMSHYQFAGIPHRVVINDVLLSALHTLSHLARLHVIHTDLKPENLLLLHSSDTMKAMLTTLDGDDASGEPPSSSSTAKLPQADFRVKLIDFGLSYLEPLEHRKLRGARRAPSSPRQSRPGIGQKEADLITIGNYHKGAVIQTREYRAPEIILGCDFSTQTDMWSVGCLTFELATGTFLFDPKVNPSVTDESSMDAQHLIDITAVIGPPSPGWLTRSAGLHTATFFDSRGRFRFGDLESVPRRKLDKELEPFVGTGAAVALANMIHWCIQWDPEQRATADMLLTHKWWTAVV